MSPSRFRALSALFVAAALALTGCSTVPSNTPEDYTATSEGNPQPVTEQNFMDACVSAEGDDAGAEDRCGCIYDRIVEEVPFEDFQEFDDRLAADPTDVPDVYTELAADCARGSSADDEGTTTTAGEGR
jgi:hypothetical protein